VSPGPSRGPRRAVLYPIFKYLEQVGGHPLVARVGALVRPATGPLELGLFGRTLLLAVTVGIIAGLVGAFFAWAIDEGQRVLLEQVAGAALLHASGEADSPEAAGRAFPWLLAVLPAAGALISGLLSRLAPETAGGGGDQTIEAFHREGATMRLRVLPVKLLASIAALVSGGAGGREGPGMQLGGAAGSLVGRLLPASARERRLLFVAGLAAGISAVFRTPLGAALFAVEVLYRDDFETDALVPSVLASVVAYAVATSILGRHALFGELPSYPFTAGHLPLYAGLAVAASAAAAAFAGALRFVREYLGRHLRRAWLRPAAGGLVLGLAVVVLRLLHLGWIGTVSPESALLGGGYGLAQLAVHDATGPAMAIAGWFVLLAVLRIVATALTVGSGASAGDFAPALVVGSLVGAAYGHAARGLLADPSLQPGAFALVGMAALYGGVAHAPLSAVVLVSELTGSYDLLVPLMLATGASHLLLRRIRLYGSQEVNRRKAFLRAWGGRADNEGPDEPIMHAATDRGSVRSVVPSANLQALRAVAASGQPIVPVVDAEGRYVGLVDASTLLQLSAEPDLPGVVAADLAGPPIGVQASEPMWYAAERLLETGLSHVPVCDGDRIVGLLALADVLRAALPEPESETTTELEIVPKG
jgi:CIC family chloride channel protein